MVYLTVGLIVWFLFGAVSMLRIGIGPFPISTYAIGDALGLTGREWSW